MKENLTKEEVLAFLEKISGEIVNLTSLFGGKHSQAFSYTLLATNENHVVRFNKNGTVFIKDAFALKNFSTAEIVIPKIISSGNYDGITFYCISEKIDGITPKDLYKVNDFTSLPLQFETIEKIKNAGLSQKLYWGACDTDGIIQLRATSFLDFFNTTKESLYLNVQDKFLGLDYFDENFMNYLIQKIKYYSSYSSEIPELIHGDFGNDNLFIENDKISGIIDWEKFAYLDHFLDVGRVVLFCPNRKETVSQALSFYENSDYVYYKERIFLGIYFAMFKNYIAALTENSKVSCLLYPERIKELELLMS